jgi:hypothetical protein
MKRGKPHPKNELGEKSGLEVQDLFQQYASVYARRCHFV